MSERRRRIRVNLSLLPGRDDIVINWLKSLGRGNASAAIRLVLHQYLSGGGVNRLPLPPTAFPQPAQQEEEKRGGNASRQRVENQRTDSVEERVDDFLAGLGVNNHSNNSK